MARAHCQRVCGLGEIVVVSGNTVYQEIDIASNQTKERRMDYKERSYRGISVNPGSGNAADGRSGLGNHPKLRLAPLGFPGGNHGFPSMPAPSVSFFLFMDSMRLFQDGTLSTPTSTTPVFVSSSCKPRGVSVAQSGTGSPYSWWKMGLRDIEGVAQLWEGAEPGSDAGTSI